MFMLIFIGVLLVGTIAVTAVANKFPLHIGDDEY